MASNESLAHAKAARDDEFYTQLADIERELHHYRKHFREKPPSHVQEKGGS